MLFGPDRLAPSLHPTARPLHGLSVLSPVPLLQKYTHHLSLYRVAPNDEVSLEEFELFAVDRLRGIPAPSLPPTHTCT